MSALVRILIVVGGGCYGSSLLDFARWGPLTAAHRHFLLRDKLHSIVFLCSIAVLLGVVLQIVLTECLVAHDWRLSGIHSELLGGWLLRLCD